MTLDRRAFTAGLIGFLAGPPPVTAQQTVKVHRVGFLSGFPVPDLVEAVRHGLRELGWIEGRNLVLETRSAERQLDRTPDLAAELVRQKVEVIVVSATSMSYLRGATGNTPVVFAIADDPVSAGYVASLARPGGRMTGLTSLNVGLDAKRLEILKAALPGITRVGVVTTPHDRAHRERVAATESGARALGLQLRFFEMSNPELLPGIFEAAGRARVEALLVVGSPTLRAVQARFVGPAAKARLPVISAWRDLPDAGGLMSYGTSVPAMFRRAATYVDRILKGANPGELPVEQASTFEMIINLRAARTLGLNLAPSVLQRADQVIE